MKNKNEHKDYRRADSKRDPRKRRKEQERKAVRQAKHAMQGRER